MFINAVCAVPVAIVKTVYLHIPIMWTLHTFNGNYARRKTTFFD